MHCNFDTSFAVLENIYATGMPTLMLRWNLGGVGVVSLSSAS